MNRNGNWIQTYTGRQFWPLDPWPDDVCIEDIAHALGNLCRFNGHCSHFYSVAEHSFIVSWFVDRDLALGGLLHDGEEAYLADVPRPVKPMLAGYKQIEKRIKEVIATKFGLPITNLSHPQIKEVDQALLADEARQVMGHPPADWALPHPPLCVEIECWSPEKATRKFLERYYEIRRIEKTTANYG